MLSLLLPLLPEQSTSLKRFLLLMASAVFVLALAPLPDAGAREQWAMNHGAAANFPYDARFLPGGSHSGWVPKAAGNFWTGQMARTIPTGTLLTGILQESLNSGKSQPGDRFTLVLQDGYSSDSRQLLPPGTKIAGTVLAVVPASRQRAGMPGTMDISLSALVFPDGLQVPIFASVDNNPTKDLTGPLRVRHAGFDLRDYGDTFRSMGRSFLTGPGFMMNRFNRGAEFEVDAGQTVVVRINRSVELPEAMLREALSPLAPAINRAPLQTAAGNTRSLNDMADPF